MRERPRRNRKSAWIRDMMRENHLAPEHFIYPLFIHDGDGRQAIESMPGCHRLGLNALLDEVGAAMDEGIGAVVLFPTEESLKTSGAEESHNPDGLVPGQSVHQGPLPDRLDCDRCRTRSLFLRWP